MKPEDIPQAQHDALLAIANALFPPPRKEGDREVTAEAYYNLEGVIQDMKAEWPDGVCISTLERVQGQIIEVQRALEKVGFRF